MTKKKGLSPRRPQKSKSTKPRPPKELREIQVNVGPAKGRPMLNWVGKHALRQVTAFPAQHIETFAPAGSEKARWSDWPKGYSQGGLLFHGDNKEVLAHLLANGFRGKVKLIYIDPPFDSGADYVRKVSLRGVNSTSKLDGEAYALGEQIQYTDIWTNDTYLQFMYERLLLLKELLSESGSLVLHSDWHKDHYLRLTLDEVFSPSNLINEIIWRRKGGTALASMNRLSYASDTLLWYAKSDSYTINPVYSDAPDEYIETQFRYREADGRRFMITVMRSPHPRANLMYDYKGYKMPPNGWSVPIDTMRKLEKQGRLFFPDSKDKQIYRKIYLDEYPGHAINNLWTDISTLKGGNLEFEDFPTQKPEELLERILLLSSDPSDLILDCFIGSGTTAAVAQKLGRRWISCDINKGSIQTTSKRLQGIIREQIEKQKQEARQEKLDFKEGGKNNKEPEPAQLSFAVYRVNDYDLQIQHNEAVNLACEHIGVQRTHNDAFFDGVQGKRLVKIVPFNHPLSPLDLEQIKNELKVRPDENRDVLVVALGKELASDAWLEEWNRMRRKGDVPNKIEVIELRTDPKYGKFIEHKPASARLKFSRKGEKISVEIEDFISPTIIERLSQQNGVVQPTVKDWRSMVDCVMIDPAYDGKVFDVALSDVPERKDDFVQGKYELSSRGKKTTVAVKIIDMLGEEVVEVREV